MKPTALKTACLTAALTTAWAAPASAIFVPTTFHAEVTPNQDLTHTYFLYSGNTSAYSVYQSATPLHDLAAGVTDAFSFDAFTGFGGYDSESYAIIGIYDQANGGVTISLDNAVAGNAIGTAALWSDLFPATSEATIATALANDDTMILASFAASASDMGFLSYLGDTSTLVNFSGATDGGTAWVTVVPEPLSLLLIAPTLTLVLRRRCA